MAGALPGRGPGPLLRSPDIPLQSLSQHGLSLRPRLLLSRKTGRSSTCRISGEAQHFRLYIVISHSRYLIMWSPLHIMKPVMSGQLVDLVNTIIIQPAALQSSITEEEGG